MTTQNQGKPYWYELTTPDVAGAIAFYGTLLGWNVKSAEMPGFDYWLARQGDALVAGMMAPMSAEGPQAFWLCYFTVDDCDASASAVTADGGSILQPPADIPGTGRFAIATDPQGAAFGILQPLDGQSGTAFDQKTMGHGNWHELASTNPVAALAFYGKLFGWKPTGAMEMPDGAGTYQIFSHNGADIGGMMGLMRPGSMSAWTPYFGSAGIEGAIARIQEIGGKVIHGPQEVPGSAYIAMAIDPQGAFFALVGPK